MKYSYVFGALAATAHAHTWIETVRVIGPNGTFTGEPGFARGNVARSTPGFNDNLMVNLLPPDSRPINDIRTSDLLCKSTQTQQQQGDGARLQAPAGARVALQYQENGHVTLPQNQPGKPDNRGTIFVYGTTEPRADDKFLDIHRVWNAQGTGGDGRGVLLSTQNYDDGQCYQVNSGQISTARQAKFSKVAANPQGANLWCQQDVQIPTTAPSGKPYTLYWVWDWPTLPGTAGFPDGKQEIYTTCMDIDVVPASGAQSKLVQAANFVAHQDLNYAAVPSQFADIANPTAVQGKFIPFTAQTAQTNGAAASSAPTSAPAGAASSAIATTSAPAASASVPANGNGNGGASGRHTFSSRPAIIPIGSESATIPQATASPQPTAASSVAAGNFGTAISAAPSASVSVVTQISTAVETVIRTTVSTVYQTAPQATTPAATGVQGQSMAVASASQSAYKLRARNFFAL